MQKSMQKIDSLSGIRAKLLKTSAPSNPNSWKGEGEDHINVSRYAKTKLGRLLDLDYPSNYDHPALGPFLSLNSLWFFLRAREKDDRIRTLTGREMKKYISDNCGGMIPYVTNFRAVIAHSAYLRIKSVPGLAKELYESTLPFDCYRTLVSGLRVRFDHSLWFTGALEEIRKALVEGRNPDFEHLLDDKSQGVYTATLKMLLPTIQDEEAEELSKKLTEGVPMAQPQKKKKKKKKPSSEAQVSSAGENEAEESSSDEAVETSFVPVEVAGEDDVVEESCAIVEVVQVTENGSIVDLDEVHKLSKLADEVERLIRQRDAEETEATEQVTTEEVEIKPI